MRIREAEGALKSTECRPLVILIPSFTHRYIELSRNLHTLSTHHSETVLSHHGADHAARIVELDTQKFRIAKAASDLEIEGERLEHELEGLKGRLRQIDLDGVEGDEVMKARRETDDPTVFVFWS